VVASLQDATVQVGNGTTYGSYADISANARRLIRFGLVVEQDQASGTIQMCHAWLEIDVPDRRRFS
jgi:hypothetical protein